jgi:hypothetical protein
VCWHLTVAVPEAAATAVPVLFAASGGATPEPDTKVACDVGRGDPCFAIGAGCACSLYKAGASDADRIRRKAARLGWSATKLARALEGVEDWSGLAPSARAGVVAVAERWGRAAVFLYWAGRGGAVSVPQPVVVTPSAFRSAGVGEGQLVIVENSASQHSA